ncbi:Sushi, von Willebrand factor type A, EGF and pentraxin domain-containing protein 1 [Holothuria leucospilota]|uniref:Sushi, von Willebrand factor type A, EGF and pentraxin domain-containing protein 1 n=1 Tax=Holothuria leucospilota TaxID=206669 RepID=A0A9Q1BMF3_HOLLE|nr:Sushi, von Willebrand factor type A, EGF and pentraxin domain-containing protein 1 [Holothuria leucospilota]
MGGPPSNTCNSGTWQFPPSTCEVWSCSQPSTSDAALNFSPDKASYDAREMVTYSCDQGYTLTGSTSASCDSSDVWNPSTVPVCTASCDAPNIANGGLTTSGPFTEGSRATVECDVGYGLASGSSSSITCQNDGTWDVIPQCYQICNVTGVENSDSGPYIEISHGGSKTITCSPGHSYNQQTSLTLACVDGNLDNTVPPKCYSDCGGLTAPNNGGVSGGNRHGETTTFTCDRGFLLNVTDSYTCNEGAWENGVETGGNTPTCYSKSLEDSITLYCNPDMFVVEIPGELLGDNFTVNSVTMGDCIGTRIDNGYLLVESNYNDCETTIEIDVINEKVLYRNLVTSADSDPVTTGESLDINVECVFDQNSRVSSSAVMQNTLSKDLSSSGSYDILFAAYSDAAHQAVINSSVRVDTNDVIYLLAQVNYVSDIDLFGSRCYATPSPEDDFHIYEDVIKDGCAVSDYVSDISDSEVTNPNFAFALTVFRFTGSGSDSIYVHCDLKICENGMCPVPDCSSGSTRRKRSTHISFSKHVYAGPIKMRSLGDTDNKSDGAWQINTALTVYSATLSALVLTSLATVGVIIYRRRSQPKSKQTGEYSRI